MEKIFLIILIVLVGLTFSIGYKVINLEPKYEEYIISFNSDEISHSYQCDITAYSADVNQTDSTPYQTALMERPVVGGTVAVSHDLKQYLGNKVYISGYGVFRVNDLMNRRFTKKIDMFVKDKRTAINFGKKENITVVFY
jgi:3D (Asp-Asp-Asp) domain-containing protein